MDFTNPGNLSSSTRPLCGLTNRPLSETSNRWRVLFALLVVTSLSSIGCQRNEFYEPTTEQGIAIARTVALGILMGREDLITQYKPAFDRAEYEKEVGPLREVSIDEINELGSNGVDVDLGHLF